VRLHAPPICSSWLNQVELWYSRIERDAIAHGIFTSLADPRRTLTRYIKHYGRSYGPVVGNDLIPEGVKS